MSNQANAKPEINLSIVNTNGKRVSRFPPGTFTGRKNTNKTLESRHWGNTPFFTNAKATSMLERGWVRSRGQLKPSQRGLFVDKDGSEEEVDIMDIKYKPFPRRGRIFTFADNSGIMFDKDENDRFEQWDFYYSTKPVPFTPRKGGKKTRKSRKRKTRRKA
uniref:Uncharacterized protein n=1 Tax=viral metagenome TaxID=1070528 RepID=A0A6C0DJP4_9ZZZZ